MTIQKKELTPDQTAFAKAWKHGQDQEELVEAIAQDNQYPLPRLRRNPISSSYTLDKEIEIITGKKITRFEDFLIDLLAPFSANIFTWGFILFVIYYIFIR